MIYHYLKLLKPLVALSLIAVLLPLTPLSFAQSTDSPASPIQDPYEGDSSAVEGPFYDDASAPYESNTVNDGYSDDSTGRNQFSLGLHFNSGVGLDLSFSQFYNRFFATEYRAHYRSFKDDLNEDTFYGADITFMFFIANPTLIVPYLGLGPGYESFNQAANGLSYANGSTVVANYTLGINIELSQNFVMQIGQRTTIYLGKAPATSATDSTEITERKKLIVRFVVRI